MKTFSRCRMELGGPVGQPSTLKLCFDNGAGYLEIIGDDKYLLWYDFIANVGLLRAYGWKLDPTLYAP